MNTVEKQTFSNKAVTVDGIEFKGCTFENSALVYAGGELPSFVDCQFNGVSLKFEDAAANTLSFLSGLRKGGFAPAVDKIVKSIRNKR
jgi:hypothetical protein